MLFDLSLKLSYEKIDAKNDKFFREKFCEFLAFDSVYSYKQKAVTMDFSPEEKLFFNMLLDIKNDLNLLLADRREKLELKYESHITKLGYEGFLLEDLIEQGEYFGHFKVFDDDMYFYFCVNEDICEFKELRKSDEAALSSFITNVQRQAIKARKASDD